MAPGSAFLLPKLVAVRPLREVRPLPLLLPPAAFFGTRPDFELVPPKPSTVPRGAVAV